jgi:hypothetical protein
MTLVTSGEPKVLGEVLLLGELGVVLIGTMQFPLRNELYQLDRRHRLARLAAFDFRLALFFCFALWVMLLFG